jgi:NAD(P)-dependent dehydrogenase (short-subunit alcohol dehydrogenase family)
MSADGHFRDRVAVGTGAAQGLGLAIAGALADAGAHVVLADIQGDAAQVAAARMCERGAIAEAAAVDVGDSAAVDRMFQCLLDRHGRVDILVNNAGKRQDVKLLIDLSDAEWQEVQRVNLTGAFYCCRAAGRIMARQGAGAIVNISSINGLQAPAMVGAYNASKAGIVSLTKTLAAELASYGVRANAVCPGPVYTEFNRVVMRQRAASLGIGESEMVERVRRSIPLGRWGEPPEIAAAVLFLCGPGAVWITGETLRVSGGLEVVSAVPAGREDV